MEGISFVGRVLERTLATVEEVVLLMLGDLNILRGAFEEMSVYFSPEEVYDGLPEEEARRDEVRVGVELSEVLVLRFCVRALVLGCWVVFATTAESRFSRLRSWCFRLRFSRR